MPSPMHHRRRADYGVIDAIDLSVRGKSRGGSPVERR
jgi:hypothetical protein